VTAGVVLFDLDDTLFAHRFAVETAVAAHRAAQGGELAAAEPTAELARWMALEELHYLRYLNGELDYLGQRRARARDFVLPFGLELDDAAADEWFQRYVAEYQAAWRLHDDALPCLAELASRGIRVGIITNGDGVFQGAKLDAVGLSGLLEHVVASGDLGFTKPDRRIFEHACALFGVEPGAALYVGDRLHTDAIGAIDAGLAGVWLARHNVSASELGEAEASGARVIRTLAELPALLG
jgi:putative hydrolase of the HAD superfamily